MHDVDDVIELLNGETLNYKEELEEIKSNARVLQSRIDDLFLDANLFSRCAEDWIFTSLVDNIDGKNDLQRHLQKMS